MSFRVLLAPEHTQELRPVVLHIERSRYPRMTSQTERQHLCRITVPRLSMMDSDRPLATLQRSASRNATAIIVAL